MRNLHLHHLESSSFRHDILHFTHVRKVAFLYIDIILKYDNIIYYPISESFYQPSDFYFMYKIKSNNFFVHFCQVFKVVRIALS